MDVRKEIAKDLAAFLNQLHSLDLNLFTELDELFPKDTDYKKIFKSQLEDLDLKNCSEDIKNDIKEYLNKLFFEFEPQKMVLRHGDLSADNFLIDDNCLSGVIDFSDSLVGDPSLDFSAFDREIASLVYENYNFKTVDFIERADFLRKRRFVFGYLYGNLSVELFKKDFYS